MITSEELMSALIKGRTESYIKKSADYDPYKKALLYDNEFRLRLDTLLYTDSYRGFNPYGGVEYVFENGRGIPQWSADYAGFVRPDIGLDAAEGYAFLKKARGSHLTQCGGNLFTDYDYEDGPLVYRVRFLGDPGAVTQTEEIFYSGFPAAQQLTCGRLIR
jgi:hypothetical protein